MNDRDTLYRAVLENPDDDTLRLVYADALEEGGDSRRAAFVRAHVELARVPEYEPEAVQAKYHNQKKKADGGRWITELPPLPEGLSWARDPFRRGLPGAIQSRDGATFVAHADDLFAQYPIESLELKGARVADMAELAACGWLGRLRSLSLVEGAGGPTLRRLLDSNHFDRLTELHLGAQLTTSPAITAVVRSRVFDQLTALSVREDRQGGGSLVGALARLAKPPRLKKLDLSSNRVTDAALAPLLASAAMETVEELNLSDNNLGAEGMEALAGATLPNLRSLNLIRTRPTGAGVYALTGASFFPELRSLGLGGNNLPSAAAERLSQAGRTNLRILGLDGNRLGGRGAAALAGGENLSGLLVLDLAEVGIDDDGADALTQSARLGGLLYLNLYGNTLTATATARLRKRFGDRVFL
ncbi:Leucine Rich repeats (2 copies) [Gemmata obscuriglobus]|uniref:TIGR02996 domain-containing protein n=1 Tax=Gemmata obscuriglobus TaxID=114 RepID=A0A2Z3GVM2_9BACT|nr:TIGR02996 domain-containing protein [Gemmata obscuriglobus]AWM36601.1 TIGR02996 domain-containing protein [Gemmata obscuriglobus]QEG30770.1 Leucine Rich repeats (2 copies) [Gemmata obscuriglobus]VTS10101.1 Repeat-companion domain protein OS=Isosphaera pallida (strain ATCC 43644 / DSM 9630 / IS1B) GN=Isop_0392 PE=4 SV=1: LRR_6: LRR_6: LRR_6 [Gemmata obscuriglobus UQM 2246]